MTPLAPNSAQASSDVALFRRTVWESRIPIVVHVDESRLPPGSDTSVEAYYTWVPRISYFPLLVPEVRQKLLAHILPQSRLDSLQDRHVSFEAQGEPLKPHWPVGVLYDVHCASLGFDPNQVELPWSVTLKLAADDKSERPTSDQLHPPPTAELCKTHFMSMLKEADFVHYGSTKRVTNLRRQEQDSLWDAIVEYNFDKYWSVASKVYPPPSFAQGVTGTSRRATLDDKSIRSNLTTHANESQTSVAASLNSGTSDAPGSTNNNATYNTGVRSIPIRFHFPDNASIAQEAVSPLVDDGKPVTLKVALSTLFPLLFPLGQAPPRVYIHGVQIPLEAQVYWLGVAFTGADGWLSVVIQIGP